MGCTSLMLFSRFSIILLFFFGTNFIVPSSACDDSDLYIIRTATGGFVAEATFSSQITIQYFTGYSKQLWRFERGIRAGYFYIVNSYYGTALTVIGTSINLQLSAKNKNLNQQWYVNSNGRLYNVGTKKVLDVYYKRYYPGTSLTVYKDKGLGSGSDNQIFTLQLRTVRKNGLNTTAAVEKITSNV